MLQLGAIPFLRSAGHRKVERIVLSRDPARNGKNRLHSGRKLGGNSSQRIRLAFHDLRITTFSGERIGERFLKGRLAAERRRHPDARHPRGFQNFDTRCHFERAPVAR